ncbi:MAG: hypothetical protein TREMPRED_000134, partial [Tremellales sp. Tagirdzhanova-0007]
MEARKSRGADEELVAKVKRRDGKAPERSLVAGDNMDCGVEGSGSSEAEEGEQRTWSF